LSTYFHMSRYAKKISVRELWLPNPSSTKREGSRPNHRPRLVNPSIITKRKRHTSMLNEYILPIQVYRLKCRAGVLLIKT
jgi:hypothetical protein